MPAAPASAPRAQRSAGTLIGRFVVLEHLGEGGMGEVLVADDPILSRKVAIKLVRGSSRDRDSRGRLLREAQAMARLSDPNVVSVYEAGIVGDEIFIAMELIEGESLRSWLAACERPWREILRVFLLAGRGLAAAHRTGFVHRDFKPDNVLVGRDGRILVTDFGLVSAVDAPTNEGGDRKRDPAAADLAPALLLSLTRTGDVVGTPRYMAPEQHRWEPASPRSDQFAYAVALHEALYRVHPFAAESHAELIANVVAGRRSSPASNDVPARILHLLSRALATSPAGRFASMEDLLERLAAASAPSAWPRRVGIATALVVTASVAGGVALVARSTTAVMPCATAGAPVVAVWGDDARRRVSDAFAAVNLPYAASALDHVLAALDDRARRLTAVHIEACEALRVRYTQSDEMRDRRMLCLARGRDVLTAAVRVLASADAETVSRAVDVVAGMGDVDTCQDEAALAVEAPPAAVRAQVTAVDQLVAEVNANRDAGRYAEASHLAEDALTRARQTRYLPVIARASAATVTYDLLRDGYVNRNLPITPLDAINAAERARDDKLAAELWVNFIYTVGVHNGLRVEARRWLPLAEAKLERAGSNPLLLAGLDNAIAGMHYWDEKYQEALARYQRVLEVRHRLLGPTNPSTLFAINNVALVRKELKEYGEALRLHLEALAGRQRVYGADHPRVGDSWENVGVVQQQMKAWDAARDSFLHAIQIRERALGQLNHRTLGTYKLLAETLIAAARYDEAAPYALRAYELNRAHPGKAIWHALNGLALRAKLEGARGDPRAARDYLRKAIDLDTGPPPESAQPLVELATVAYELGDGLIARRALGRALRLEEPGERTASTAEMWQRAHRLARQLGMEK